jgi:hypothetical protein
MGNGTFLYWGMPDYSYGSLSYIEVRIWPSYDTYGIADTHGLGIFDLAAFPAHKIVCGATLNLNEIVTGGHQPIPPFAGEPDEVYLYRCTRTDWAWDATWNCYDPPQRHWAATGGDYTYTDPVRVYVPVVPAPASIDVDVTALVRDAVENRGKKFSWLMWSDDRRNEDREVWFDKLATLDVYYTDE